MPTSRYRRGMKTGVVHKSYGVALPMNRGKLKELLRLLPVWRRGLSHSLSQWRRELFEDGRLVHLAGYQRLPRLPVATAVGFRVPSGEGRVRLMVDEPAKRVP